MDAQRYRYHRQGGLNDAGLTADEVLALLGERMMEESPDAVLHDVLRSGLQSNDGERLAGLDDVREALRNAMVAEATAAHRELLDGQQSLSASLGSDASSLLRTLMLAPERAPVLRIPWANEIDELIGALEGTAVAGHLQRMGEMGRLDHQLRNVTSLADLQHISHEQISAIAGGELAAALLRLVNSLQNFSAGGMLRPSGKRLSAHAMRKLSDILLRESLREIRGMHGDHRSPARTGTDRGDDRREYRFGDPFDLDIRETLLNASRRDASLPLQLRASDLTIFERDPSSRAATVLAIDRSRSMGEHSFIAPARRLAMTYASLLRHRFRQDQLFVIGFSREAHKIDIDDLDELDWDRHTVGTNIQDAFDVAERTLASCHGFQQRLTVITDGEPTAWRDAYGDTHYVEPPNDDALAATFAAARRCRKRRIEVTIVLLTHQKATVKFAEQLASEAGGRLEVIEADAISRTLLRSFA